MVTIFIVVSNMLRSVEYLNKLDDAPLPIQFGDALLFSLKEQPWKDLKVSIVKLIDKEKTSLVRIVGHMNPCFGEGVNKWQQRFPEHEKEFAQTLQEFRKESWDIQIWGFHHENQSKIWDSLRIIKQVVAINTDSTQQERFVQNLLKSFELADARNAYEQFSVVKHRIIHLFLPVKIKLEVASDEGNDVLSQSERNALQETLNDKLKTAKGLLKQCDVIAIAEKADEKMRVIRFLENGPQLRAQEFNKWIFDLDIALNNLREGLIR